MSVPGPTPATVHGKASRPLQQFLAFDYGRKRTGVATGERLAGTTAREKKRAVIAVATRAA